MLVRGVNVTETNLAGLHHQPWDLWFVRNLPVRATYDTYTRIEDWEEGLILDTTLQMLREDLLPFEFKKSERFSYEDLHGCPAPCVENLKMENLVRWLPAGDVRVDRRHDERQSAARMIELGHLSDKERDAYRKRMDLPPEPHYVTQALVRRDVWEALCEMKWDNQVGRMIGLEDMMKGVDELIAVAKRIRSVPKRYQDLEVHLMYSGQCEYASYIASTGGCSPYGVAVAHTMRWLVRRCAEGKIEALEDLRPALGRGAQVAHIERMMRSLRLMWHPQLYQQRADFDTCMEFHLRCARIAFDVESDNIEKAQEEFDPADEDDREEIEHQQKRYSDLQRLRQFGP
jgi:hypothetical protein